MQVKVRNTFKLKFKFKIPENSCKYHKLFHTYDTQDCTLDVVFCYHEMATPSFEKEMAVIIDSVLKKFKTPLEVKEVTDFKTAALDIFTSLILKTPHIEKIILYERENLCYIVEH